MLFSQFAPIYLLSDRMLLQKGINSSSFIFALAFPLERVSGADDSDGLKIRHEFTEISDSSGGSIPRGRQLAIVMIDKISGTTK